MLGQLEHLSCQKGKKQVISLLFLFKQIKKNQAMAVRGVIHPSGGDSKKKDLQKRAIHPSWLMSLGEKSPLFQAEGFRVISLNLGKIAEAMCLVKPGQA